METIPQPITPAGVWSQVEIIAGDAGNLLDKACEIVGLPPFCGSAYVEGSPHNQLPPPLPEEQTRWWNDRRCGRSMHIIVNHGSATPQYKTAEVLRTALGDTDAPVWCMDTPVEAGSFEYRNGWLNPPSALPRQTPREAVIWFALTVDNDSMRTARMAYVVKRFDPATAPDPKCKRQLDFSAAVDQLNALSEARRAAMTQEERDSEDQEWAIRDARAILRSLAPTLNEMGNYGKTRYPDPAERLRARHTLDAQGRPLSDKALAYRAARVAEAEATLAAYGVSRA